MRSLRGGNSSPWRAYRTALVAAKDEDVRRLLTEALTRAGYRTDSYADPELVRNQTQTAGRSFLILEGGAGAMDAVHRLRKRGGHLPILLLSSGHLPRTDVPDGQGGFVGYLPLPFTMRTLEEAIDRATRPVAAGGSASLRLPDARSK